MKKSERARGKLLEAWEPPANAGKPVGVVASTFSFDAGFFEEELLGRFLSMESSPSDGQVYLLERETLLGELTATVLVDRRHAERTKTLAWDLLVVPVPFQCCQHAKVSVLAWERAVRVIVGSANLTEPGYRRNIETFARFDFSDGSGVPRSVAVEFLEFLDRMVRRVPVPAAGSTQGPVPRALGLLASIRAQVDVMQLPEEWARGQTAAHPILLEPRRGSGVLEQMAAVWGGGPGPDTADICSPYWAAPTSEGRDPVMTAVGAQMAKRGDREILIRVPGERENETEWVAFAPESIRNTPLPRTRFAVLPVPPYEGDEARALHAKLLRWSRGGENPSRDLLLSGSSNATEAGLGLGTAPRNLEANVCFVSDGNPKTTRWFAAALPAAEFSMDVKLRRPEGTEADEDGGGVPIPAFFAWALVDVSEDEATVEVAFDLTQSEPKEWSIGFDGFAQRLGARSYAAEDRPEIWRAVLPLALKRAPDALKVRWRSGEAEYEGELPINARSSASRCDASGWAKLNLETLLDIFGAKTPLFRSLRRALAAGRKSNGAGVDSVHVDPHRRVDTSGFLMQRMRRVSRALEGLGGRLARPVLTEASLEFRFSGPLSPVAFAKRLLEATTDDAERTFLAVEVARTVARAKATVEVLAVPKDLVDARFDAALGELVRLIPKQAEGSQLQGYVRRALSQVPQGAHLHRRKQEASDGA